ncbi:biotin--[acetyl-CoA-carboxylase] ligase [Hydrogenovibrio halophilus]|uniref:biotin--[acetyl-CoA-carboxylase] ligase n=1 Tax=Hydrogenovibrio halophilus TaxID=373391 RepID=UPI0003651C02|nr:biotin--[acetyl-CoA-carboxylase] ligase [Hydrogenovibrio halophilus]
MTQTYDLIELETVDSTSQYLKRCLSDQSIDRPLVCMTHEQTAGYGQQNRVWHSNDQSAIFSIAYPIDRALTLSGHASLKLASLLHQSLQSQLSIPLFLKWPNDLYDAHGKVAGILIEQALSPQSRCLVIGMGINRGPDTSELLSGGYQASALPDFSTHDLIADLMAGLQPLDFSLPWQPDQQAYWQSNDWFQKGESVLWLSNGDSQPATYLGINSLGQAELEVQQCLVPLSSGVNAIRKR